MWYGPFALIIGHTILGVGVKYDLSCGRLMLLCEVPVTSRIGAFANAALAPDMSDFLSLQSRLYTLESLVASLINNTL